MINYVGGRVEESITMRFDLAANCCYGAALLTSV